MTPEQIRDVPPLSETIAALVDRNDLAGVADAMAAVSTGRLVGELERLNSTQRAVAFRLLAKDRALSVFEDFSPGLQGDLVRGLRGTEVTAIFTDLDPDARVRLLDELPASVAPRLLRGLPPRERELTAAVLGYPHGVIGRRMSPEYVSAGAGQTVVTALDRIRGYSGDPASAHVVLVLDDERRVVGAVRLPELLRADPSAPLESLMGEAPTATADLDAEIAARRCADQGLLVLPVVDRESRLVGVLTLDDAVRILEREESEDAARQGGVEPLPRPYLSTPILRLVRSRVVWLLVLAVGAAFTVQVLSIFEATLEQVTLLALFVPLLIGTGGNTGNQAATTVTRALALDDVRPRDAVRVLGREVRVGFLLGALLGSLGFVLTTLVYEVRIGLVVGLTLLVICTMAASVGGTMPLVARAIRVDPAVFSNPFISTFVDAAGLVVYFLIAKAILRI